MITVNRLEDVRYCKNYERVWVSYLSETNDSILFQMSQGQVWFSKKGLVRVLGNINDTYYIKRWLINYGSVKK